MLLKKKESLEYLPHVKPNKGMKKQAPSPPSSPTKTKDEEEMKTTGRESPPQASPQSVRGSTRVSANVSKPSRMPFISRYMSMVFSGFTKKGRKKTAKPAPPIEEPTAIVPFQDNIIPFLELPSPAKMEASEEKDAEHKIIVEDKIIAPDSTLFLGAMDQMKKELGLAKSLTHTYPTPQIEEPTVFAPFDGFTIPFFELPFFWSTGKQDKEEDIFIAPDFTLFLGAVDQWKELGYLEFAKIKQDFLINPVKTYLSLKMPPSCTHAYYRQVIKALQELPKGPPATREPTLTAVSKASLRVTSAVIEANHAMVADALFKEISQGFEEDATATAERSARQRTPKKPHPMKSIFPFSCGLSSPFDCGAVDNWGFS